MLFFNLFMFLIIVSHARMLSVFVVVVVFCTAIFPAPRTMSGIQWVLVFVFKSFHNAGPQTG